MHLIHFIEIWWTIYIANKELIFRKCNIFIDRLLFISTIHLDVYIVCKYLKEFCFQRLISLLNWVKLYWAMTHHKYQNKFYEGSILKSKISFLIRNPEMYSTTLSEQLYIRSSNMRKAQCLSNQNFPWFPMYSENSFSYYVINESN